MTIADSTPTAPRINPSELRYLRQAIAACSIGCKLAAMQAIVVYAQLHDGLDLSDEARYLQKEMEMAGQPHLSATTLSL